MTDWEIEGQGDSLLHGSLLLRKSFNFLMVPDMIFFPYLKKKLHEFFPLKVGFFAKTLCNLATDAEPDSCEV